MILATNRMVDTVISRKIKNRNMVSDFRDIWRIGGLKSMYAGFIPFTISIIMLYNHVIRKPNHKTTPFTEKVKSTIPIVPLFYMNLTAYIAALRM